jgi:hypothetical protein
MVTKRILPLNAARKRASSSELPAAGGIRKTIGAVEVERSSLGLSDAARSSCTSKALRFRRGFRIYTHERCLVRWNRCIAIIRLVHAR